MINRNKKGFEGERGTEETAREGADKGKERMETFSKSLYQKKPESTRPDSSGEYFTSKPEFSEHRWAAEKWRHVDDMSRKNPDQLSEREQIFLKETAFLREDLQYRDEAIQRRERKVERYSGERRKSDKVIQHQDALESERIGRSQDVKEIMKAYEKIFGNHKKDSKGPLTREKVIESLKEQSNKIRDGELAERQGELLVAQARVKQTERRIQQLESKPKAFQGKKVRGEIQALKDQLARETEDFKYSRSRTNDTILRLREVQGELSRYGAYGRATREQAQDS